MTIKSAADPRGIKNTDAEMRDAVVNDENKFTGADIGSIKTYTDKIDDATDGLTAIKAEVEGLAGAAMRGTNSALLAADYTGPDNAGITAIEAKTDNLPTDPADQSLLNALIAAPTSSLIEAWQDEAGLDPLVWTWTDPATGIPWTRYTAPRLYYTVTLDANETARLRSNQRWEARPDQWGSNSIHKRLVVEFELLLASIWNIDNSLFFLGLTIDGVAASRASEGIMGWGLSEDALQSITDNIGTETTNTGFGETLTDWNKLRMEIYEGHVKFYINEVEVADHTTNLADRPKFLNFFIDTDAGGFATFYIGVIRIWHETVTR